MATTIKSTDLDFDQIKNNLKLYLAQQDEFADYNFEGSALSNILDVLAYNTHYNALLANFALNESYLSTAQLRSSLVGLAGSLGYTVGSRTASYGVVNLWVTNPSAPSTMTMPTGFKFNAKIDNVTYTFKTRDTLQAVNNGSNQYFFYVDNNINIPIYEGVQKSKIFIAGPSNESDTYVIPVSNLDLETVVVRVYDDVSDTNYNVYTNINKATTINSNSRIYVIKESPNGYYELTFGNGVRLGQTPDAGNKIEVLYDVVQGPDANGARVFTPTSELNGLPVNVTTVSNSIGGALKENIDSIRKNAPYQYAAQNRMVTAEDYAALSLRNYPTVINDIKAWGGEDNIPPKYGSVFLSIVFDATDTTIQEGTKTGIINLAKDLSVASFTVEFVDPVETFLEVNTRFQFNPNLTSSSLTTVETLVKNTMQSYFDANLGGFDQSFRRSNMLSDVDASDESVLSSRAEIKMQRRFVPTISGTDYAIEYPTSIAGPADDFYVIQSDNFYYNGKVCTLRNKLNSNSIEIVNVSSGTIELDNTGYYDSSNGIIYLNAFSGTIISGSYIRITAFPANQSVINPQRNNIIKFDASASRSIAVITDTV